MSGMREGKVALLMGLWSEVAQVTARLLAATGHRLLLVGPEEAEINRTARRINFAKGEAQVLKADIHSWGRKAMHSFEAIMPYRRVDVLYVSPFLFSDQPDFSARESGGMADAVPDVRSIVLPMLVCLTRMMRQNYGRVIVDISNEEQWQVPMGDDCVLLIENLMVPFVGMLAAALSDYNITINVLTPAPDQQDAEAKARAIVHLVSEKGRNLTGHIVKVVKLETETRSNMRPTSRAKYYHDQSLLALDELCHDALRNFAHRMN